MSNYKLELSRDAGVSYQVVEEADTLSLLNSFCEEFDKKGWRWVVKDSDGNIVRSCAIHNSIIRAMEFLKK